jgi:hypothetical protein
LISFNNNSDSKDSENKNLIIVIVKTNALFENKKPKINVINKLSDNDFSDIKKLYSQCLQKSLQDQILTLIFITLTFSATSSVTSSAPFSAPSFILVLTTPFLSRPARKRKPTAKQVSQIRYNKEKKQVKKIKLAKKPKTTNIF